MVFAGGTNTEGASKARRSRLEIIVEVLRELQMQRRAGLSATPYLLEHRLGLQGRRLKGLLNYMTRIGLIDERLVPTNRAHSFLTEYATQVLPFLERYGLGQSGNLGSPK